MFYKFRIFSNSDGILRVKCILLCTPLNTTWYIRDLVFWSLTIVKKKTHIHLNIVPFSIYFFPYAFLGFLQKELPLLNCSVYHNLAILLYLITSDFCPIFSKRASSHLHHVLCTVLTICNAVNFKSIICGNVYYF